MVFVVLLLIFALTPMPIYAYLRLSALTPVPIRGNDNIINQDHHCPDLGMP